MSEKRYYWLKLYDTFFENKTSKYLRKLPDGDKLLLGALDKTKTIEYLNENTFMLSEMQDLIVSEGSSAARVRKHRNKYKALQSNIPVTSGNSEVTDLLRRDRYR